MLLAWAFLAPALGQSASGDVRALTRTEAEAERLKKMLQGASTYVDRVMEPGDLPTLGRPDEDAPPVGDGYRSWVSETRMSVANARGGLALRSSKELGQHLAYRRETLNYGGFEFEADLRAASEDGLGLGAFGAAGRQRSGRFTARNFGFPITTRWFADTAAGDLYSEVTDALARTYRTSLGTRPVRGLSTRVYADGFDLRAGTGRRGTLAGGPYPGFDPVPGQLSWLGASQRLAPRIAAGAQIARASGVGLDGNLAPANGPTQEIDSFAASAGYDDGDPFTPSSRRAKITAIHSQARSPVPTGEPRQATGWFAEGTLAQGSSLRHEFGLYAAERNLYFGDYPLPSDNRGAYWRLDATASRFNWGLGLQVEDTNPSGAPDRRQLRQLTLQANGDWRLGRSESLGLSLQVDRRRNRLDADDPLLDRGSQSYYVTGYYQLATYGGARTRLRATLRRNQVLVTGELPATGQEVELEHDWVRGRFETMRPEFVTTLGLAREESNGITTLRPTAGLSFRYWIDPDWTVSGNLRYTSRRSKLSVARGVSGVLDTERQLANGWRVGASLTLNQAVVDLDTLVEGQPRVVRSDDKVATVYVRWEGSAGATQQGIGASGSVGGGGLGGLVFFDENRDGERQPNEPGVPGVEVLLDGRHRTVTNKFGRFDFPLVTTGRHQLSLRLESVPLPWGTAPGQTWRAEVPLRGEATLFLPVVKVGE